MSSGSENRESSSSSEDELITLINKVPRPKVYRTRNNPLEMYDEVDFKRRYRFSKNSVNQLIDIFDIKTEYTTNRNFPVTPLFQLLITLRFFATGCFQEVLGDDINIHKSTVCRIIPRITEKIASMSKQFIQLPHTPEDITGTMSAFYKIQGFPRVVGCVDCTHIKIISPGGENPEVYRNRKGWFSINTQVVCNAHLKICDIVARWPGSVHDSTIFNASALRAQFETYAFGNGYLLGDSGYACRNYLLTPILNPSTPAQGRYNTSHIHTRNNVERTFGIWKKRFLCLSQGMRLKPEKVVNIIIATAVLHNFAIDQNDILPIDDALLIEAVNIDVEDINIPVRTALINTVFDN